MKNLEMSDKYYHKDGIYSYWEVEFPLHRIDGPAVILDHGHKEYWVEGYVFDEDVFWKIRNASKEELNIYLVSKKNAERIFAKIIYLELTSLQSF